MNKINTLIERCFGISDFIFCLHPIEVQNGIELISFAKENKMGREELLNSIINYLKLKDVGEDHLEQQKLRVNQWLDKYF